MAKTMCRVLGTIFLIVGLLGFFVPHLLGMHLGATHNMIHILTGAIAAWLGWRGTYGTARVFCLAVGAVYALLGIAGLVTGAETLKLIPGELEFGRADSVVHLLAGGAFLFGGLRRPRIGERMKGAVDNAKEKMGV